MVGNIPNQIKINVAVLGLGKHSCKNILPALNECKSISLAGVYSRNKETVEESVRHFGCVSWDSMEQMLADNSIDAVYLSTPIGLHLEQGLKILAANKHFWCEKPIAYNSRDAHKLVEIARQKKLSLCEGFMYQYHPQFQWLKNYVNQDEFGVIKSIRCRFGLPFLDEPGFRNTAALGGGALLDVGCYPLSAVLDLFPEAEPEVKYLRIHIPEGCEVDMDGSAMLNIDGEIDVFLDWGIGRGYQNEIDIWGSNGSVYTDKIFSKSSDYEPLFILSSMNGKKTQISCDPANHFIAMFEYFGELVGNDTITEFEYGRIIRRARYLSEIFEARINH